MDNTIDTLLSRAVDLDASDVHLKVGSSPIVRTHGELRRLDEFDSLRPDDTKAYAEGLFSERAAADFAEHGVSDFAYGKQELGRFRVTAFRQRGSVSLVLRRVQAGSQSFGELGLPRAAEKAASANSGLVVISGPSGSGKTTTVSSIIDWINGNRAMAILTIEDPIEILHPDKKSAVVQREVGVDTPDVATAVRSAMRHDVDLIMISEIADAETARAAIDAAETGHLVLTTMRTADAAETVTRLVSMFPESQQQVIRSQLAGQLHTVISQRLLEANAGGMALACEVLTNNERSQDWIRNAGDTTQLTEVIKEGGFHGMQSFDQAFVKLVMDGVVELEKVLPFARNVHELRARVMTSGVAV
jgi:twitching motility protein PilT